MNRYEYRAIETFCGECGIATCGFSCGASLPYFEIKIPKADTEAIETYTDTELKMLLKEPDIRKCGFVTYRSWVIVNFLLSTGIRQNSLINIRNVIQHIISNYYVKIVVFKRNLLNIYYFILKKESYPYYMDNYISDFLIFLYSSSICSISLFR